MKREPIIPLSPWQTSMTPGNMPLDLRKAHKTLDKAVDRVFSDKPLESEEERQKALLEVYEKMTED